MQVKMSLIAGGKKGKVGKINVGIGDNINKGDILVNVETGKGNTPIKATVDAGVKEILIEEGQEVSTGQILFEIEESSENTSSENKEQESNKVEATEMSPDLLIIGAGPGGYVAAIYAAKKGLKVAIAEMDRFGGTCLNVGCIPTKALVKSSEICHHAKESSTFGIDIDGDIKVNMPKVIDRKDEVKDKLVSGIDYLMEKNKITVLKGKATFEDNKVVKISGDKNYVVKAKDIIIATGSNIAKVNIPGIDLPFVLNSTTALSLKELPKSITIIGGGVIGMEFACIYRNFGVEVHVLEFMDRLLTMVDSDISKEIKNRAIEMGIDIHTSSKVLNIKKTVDSKAVVTFEDKDGEHLLVSEKVFVAIGRTPNVEGLSIDKTDVELNENGRGIKVDSNMKTNVKNIYAIGDVTNLIQLAHVASHQGIVAVENILGNETKMDYESVPNVIFTSPEIASVGKTIDQCKKEGLDIKVGKFDFAGNGKALTMNEPEGFIKLIEDNKTGKIIGGSIIGADASSLISAVTLAVANGLTKDEIAHTVFPHPTTGEVIHEAAFDLGIGALHQ